jgi:hypothetical protein
MLEVWREITAERNGKIIKGSFKFVDGMVTARTQRFGFERQSLNSTKENTGINACRLHS